MKRIIVPALLIAILFGCGNKEKAEKMMSIIPKPDSVIIDGSRFISGARLLVRSTDEKLAQYFAQRIEELTGLPTLVNPAQPMDGKETINIRLTIDETLAGIDEKYTLAITENGIDIRSKSSEGVFYGVQTLLQMLFNGYQDGEVQLPLAVIEDEPRFGWRGMHLDVSRHFFDKGFIKKYLDILALYKMNVFHWHLTDDQGWRIQIDAYPKLTELGAWRKGTGKEEWNYEIEAAVEGEEKYGGYYTKDDIREIVAYAAERHITVVPEIELPGHSWAALYAYPELSCTGKPWKKPKDVSFEFSDPFCAGNEKTFEFFEKVFTEVLELFPSPYIHIGGDEAKKTPWEKCPKCNKRMRDEGLKDADQLQTYFINRVAEFIRSKGRKVIGWDEIAHKNNNKDLIIMSWRGDRYGITSLQKGHKVIFAPGSHLYFNRPQFSNKIEYTEYNEYIRLNDVYKYDPAIPAKLKKDRQKDIMGLEGCLWSEFLYSEDIAFERLLPRLAALSEIAWTPKNGRNTQDFLKRLRAHYRYLDKNNIHYFVSPPLGLKDDAFVETPFTINLRAPFEDAKIYYTLDG